MAKTDRTDHTQPGNELALRNAVFLAPRWRVFEIVEAALDAREAKNVSRPAKQQFQAAVKASGISPPKFEKNPHRAPTFQLFEPVRDLMTGSDRLAGSVFRVWAEAQRHLRVSVEEYATSNGLPVEGPDNKNRRFRGLMPLKAWNDAIGAITRNKANSHHPYDAAIMFCMVTGYVPEVIEPADGLDQVVGGNPPFDRWLDELKSSFSNPNDLDAADKFIREASGAVEAGRRDRQRISELIDKSAGLRREFMPELVFLGRALPAIFANSRPTLAGRTQKVEDALDAIDRLETALGEFRAASSVEYASWELWKQGTEKEAEAAKQVHSRIQELHEALPAPDVPPELNLVEEPNVIDTNGGLGVPCARCRDLETEKKELKANLYKANQRLAVQWNSDNKKADPPAANPAESVGEAVARAQVKFGNQGLLFLLNRASNADTEFEQPEAVYDALEWLATTYRTGKTSGGLADPVPSLKTACPGWKYASGNSDVAMNKYPEAYSTRAPDGRNFTLEHHLKKGVKNEERHMIRIAFDWDDEQQMVVIGYIGKHQPSRY